MKSSDKQQPDAQAKQALDKDPISLPSPLKQAENRASAKKQGQKTGDVTGHGGSMSVQHGSPFLDSLDSTHIADMQSTADAIGNGSSLSLPQSTDAIGNNSDAFPQVDPNIDAHLEKEERNPGKKGSNFGFPI